MARAADIPLTIDDFQEVADRTPYLADLKKVYNHKKYINLLTWIFCLDRLENM